MSLEPAKLRVALEIKDLLGIKDYPTRSRWTAPGVVQVNFDHPVLVVFVALDGSGEDIRSLILRKPIHSVIERDREWFEDFMRRLNGVERDQAGKFWKVVLEQHHLNRLRFRVLEPQEGR